MKTFICTFAAISMVSVSSFFLGGCSVDNDYDYPEDMELLDIDTQISKKRNTSGESIGTDPYEEAKRIPERENECALYALTSLKVNSKYDWIGHNTTAEEYYNKLSNYAADEFEYEGGEMEPSVVFEVGKHFGLFNAQMSFNGNAAEYFETIGDLKTVKIVNVWDGISEFGHTGTFYSYNRTTKEVTYKDKDGRHTLPAKDVRSIYIMEKK